MINGKRVVATISARMSSTRLPGKVLLPMAGEPVIVRMVQRLGKSKYVDEIIVATTVNPSDDAIERLCRERGIRWYRGSEEDVLARVCEAARACKADIVFRGMADSPVVDWRILDFLIEKLEEGKYDYASNELGEAPFPDGFDASVFPMAVINEVERVAHEPMYREHVTYYIRTHPEKYKIFAWQAEGLMKMPGLRLTLDTPEDYKLLTIIYDALFPTMPDFSADDILKYLAGHPDLVAINSSVKQKIPTA